MNLRHWNTSPGLTRAISRLALASGLLAGALAFSPPARAQVPAVEPQKTIVKADRLEATNSGVEGHYVFIGNVRITGTNLEITCDRLEIFSVSAPGKDAKTEEKGAFSDAGNIRRMLATGHVSIAQEGRTATCGVAEVLPHEDRIILTEDPVITDIATGVTMKGTRMTVNKEREAQIENPEVVGPALPNLGFPGANDANAPAATPPAAKPSP